MDDLTRDIIGAAIEVHNQLGPGLLETIYEQAMCHELALREIPYQQQVEVDIFYKDKKLQGQRLDLLVQDEVIIEIKSLRQLPEVALAQTLSYLKATGLKRALLINFGEKHLKNGIRRISL